MVDREQAVNLYNQGKTLREIGEEFGVSRQRVWQVLKPLAKKITTNHTKKYSKKCPRPEEIFVAKKLEKMGATVEIQVYNNYYDLLVNGLKVEIKHRTKVHGLGNGSKGYSFLNLIPKYPIDFFIFICGELESATFYIIPASKVKFGTSFAYSYKNYSKRMSYKENWGSLIQKDILI